MRTRTRHLDTALGALALLGVLAVLLPGLGAFGIWDPWELSAADLARRLAEGEGPPLKRPPLGPWLLARAFALLGVHEWAGRLPVALSAVLAVALAGLMAWWFSDRRSGVLAVVVGATTPLMVLHGRLMLGDAPLFAAQAAVALCAAAALYRPLAPGREQGDVLRATFLWAVGLAASAALATLAAGVLRGVLPPLLAVSVVAALEGAPARWRDDRRVALVSSVLLGLSALLAIGTAVAVAADRAAYSHWTGGAPRGGDPPTFENVLEDVFHGFAPWSALLLPALARLLGAPRDEAYATAEVSVRRVVVLWVAFGYASTTLASARYGPAAFPALGALAIGVAWLLRDVERSGAAWWSVAAMAVFFCGLAIRDFGLYPASPVDALGLDGVQVPDAFHPTGAWALVLGLFGLAAAVSLGAAPQRAGRPSWRAPYDLLRAQWRRGPAYKLWIGGFGGLLGGALLFGAASWLLGDRLPLTTLALRVGRALLLVVLSLPLLVAGLQGALWGLGRLGRWRATPVAAAGLIAGLYVAHGFLPELSAHYSPKEVYDRYAQLAGPGEPLGEYRVGGRAAAYYAKGDVKELRNQGELVSFLLEPGRRWAVLPADELPAVDRAFRRRADRHLFAPELRGARVVLVASEPVPGVRNHNFLAEAVLDAPPPLRHRVGGVFDEAIELVGYELDLPHEGYVGAGERFVVTWVWRVRRRVPGAWKIFLHVDGQGLRLNGDHVPVQEKYPVHLWEPGDVIRDRQELRVPANFRPGRYTFYIGFFSGERRLPVTSGEEDGADRLVAGHLDIR